MCARLLALEEQLGEARQRTRRHERRRVDEGDVGHGRERARAHARVGLCAARELRAERRQRAPRGELLAEVLVGRQVGERLRRVAPCVRLALERPARRERLDEERGAAERHELPPPRRVESRLREDRECAGALRGRHAAARTAREGEECAERAVRDEELLGAQRAQRTEGRERGERVEPGAHLGVVEQRAERAHRARRLGDGHRVERRGGEGHEGAQAPEARLALLVHLAGASGGGRRWKARGCGRGARREGWGWKAGGEGHRRGAGGEG